jgi:two-component system response regulator AlgR
MNGVAPTVSRSWKTLIIDDEPLAVERLQILCAKVPEIDLAGTATHGAAALRLVEALSPELLLLDIDMPGMDGLAVARALQGMAQRPAIIFTTAFDQFAVAAFDVAAVDYLLKPIALERLQRAVSRLGAQNVTVQSEITVKPSPWTQEFWVSHRDEIIRVPAKEIDLIEAERDYMRLHVGTRSYLLLHTISELERCLDPEEFVRLHRSAIARRDRIAGFKHDGAGAWQAQLHDGRMLKVGRTFLPKARAMAGR